MNKLLVFVAVLALGLLLVPYVRADGEDVADEGEDAAEGGEERSEFIQFQVEEVLDTMESNDISEVMNLFSDNARGTWNGASLQGKAAIQESLGPFFDLLAHTRFSVVSQIHESQRRATFVRVMYMESLVGCLAVVRSLEELVFDESGKIDFFRSEWDQSTAAVMDELNCKTDDKEHGREELTPEKQRLADTVYEMIETYEQLDANEMTNFLSDDAVASRAGAPDLVGKDNIREYYQTLFSRSRNFVAAPVSQLFIRENVASALINFFIVTTTGCSTVVTMAVHYEFNAEGKISHVNASLVGMDYKQLGEWIQQDCGDSDSTEEGAAGEGEGEAEGEGADAQQHEQQQQQQQQQDL